MRSLSRKPNVVRLYGKSLSLQIDYYAGVAQLVEQRFCKPSVMGSSPLSSLLVFLIERSEIRKTVIPQIDRREIMRDQYI